MNMCPKAAHSRELVGAIIDPSLRFCRESLAHCLLFGDVS